MDTMKAAGTRGLALAPVAALLLSVAFLLLGNGLLSTLLIVRAGQAGFSSGSIAAMTSAYFSGFSIGALLLPRVITSVGNVRTFAGFAAIASMTALLHAGLVESFAWMSLRMITGLAYAGMILSTESWLNAHALPSTRGQLLSIFGVVSMGSWALGQALLNIAPPAGMTLFLIGSVLISAAVVPITLLPGHPPTEVEQDFVAFRDLLRISPLATVGVFLAGLAIGGFWGMGPTFAQRIGLDVGGISAFMAAFADGPSAEKVRAAMTSFYPAVVDSHKGQFRAVFAELLQGDDGAILYHCSAGKDRTGVLVALLLSMCDVFVGKHTSNVFRTAYELHVARCDCAPPFVSLDAPWCADWGVWAGDSPHGRFMC